MSTGDKPSLSPPFQTLPGLAQPVALAVGFQYMHPVSQTIQQGARQPFTAQDLGQFSNGKFVVTIRLVRS
jgi:hypothetical protein